MVSVGFYKILFMLGHLSFGSVLVSGYIVKAPRDTEALVGQTTYFNCSTSFLNDPNEIAWYHFPIGSIDLYVYSRGLFNNYGDRFQVNNDPSTGTIDLIIPSVEERDAGEYVCEDEGGLGRNSTRKAQLTVLARNPVCRSNISSDGVIGPNDCKIKIEPEYFQLLCSVPYRGNVPPNMEWKKVGDNSTITTGLTHEKADNNITYKLTMKGDLELDGSTYVCQTTRSATTQYNCTSDQVKVIYAIKSTSYVNETRSGTVGDIVQCSINSSQTCTYKWKWMNAKGNSEESNNQTWIAELGQSQRCEVHCDIRGTPCDIEEPILVKDKPRESSQTSSTTVSAVVGIITAVVVAAIVVMLVIYFQRDKCKCVTRKTTTHDDVSLRLLQEVGTDSSPSPQQMYQSIKEDPNNEHRIFLEDRMDPDFGLLRKLNENSALTKKDLDDINKGKTVERRNKQLLDFILKNDEKTEKLKVALKETGQAHLANYLNALGVYDPNAFDGDWPLTEDEMNILKKNHEIFRDRAYPAAFLNCLVSKKIIKQEQLESITSHRTPYEKNDSLLESFERLSLKQYKSVIECLQESDKNDIEPDENYIARYFSGELFDVRTFAAEAAGPEQAVLEHRIKNHENFIKDRIDPDFGLLDILYTNFTLTRREINEVRQEETIGLRNFKLYEYILKKRRTKELMVALVETGQTHVINFLEADGVHDLNEFGDDWPLNEQEINSLANTKLYHDNRIVDPDYEGRKLYDCLYVLGVVSSERMEFVVSRQTPEEKNDAMFDVLERCSLKQYRTAIDCLHELAQGNNLKYFSGKKEETVKLTNDDIKNRILEIYQRFVTTVDADRLSDYLIVEKVMTPEDWERIVVEKLTKEDSCRKLLGVLLEKRNSKTFVILRQALMDLMDSNEPKERAIIDKIKSKGILSESDRVIDLVVKSLGKKLPPERGATLITEKRYEELSSWSDLQTEISIKVTSICKIKNVRRKDILKF